VVALFADWEGHGQAIAWWRERAGGKGRVSARRIFQVVEVEDKLAGFLKAVRGEPGVEKAASRVSRGCAGGVAEDEKESGFLGILQDRLDAIGLPSKRKFGSPRNGLIVVRSDKGGEPDSFLRKVRDPAGGDAIAGVGREPFEAVEADKRRRMSVLDAQREPVFAVHHVHVERPDGEVGVIFVAIRIGAERLRFRRGARDEKIFREAASGRKQRNTLVFEMKDAEVCRIASGEMDFVIHRRTERIIPGFEPFKAGQGEPAVGLLKLGNMLGAPGIYFFLPRSILWASENGKKQAERNEDYRPHEKACEVHARLYPEGIPLTCLQIFLDMECSKNKKRTSPNGIAVSECMLWRRPTCHGTFLHGIRLGLKPMGCSLERIFRISALEESS
jgi:hypothetical protein